MLDIEARLKWPRDMQYNLKYIISYLLFYQFWLDVYVSSLLSCSKVIYEAAHIRISLVIYEVIFEPVKHQVESFTLIW